ncbi:MAG: hypothetical protein U0P81_09465 [Holophagaceae bacterium]
MKTLGWADATKKGQLPNTTLFKNPSTSQHESTKFLDECEADVTKATNLVKIKIPGFMLERYIMGSCDNFRQKA